MNPVIGKCPVCGDELAVTRLECGSCGTEIAGHFSLPRLLQLDLADLRFIEVFVKNRGSALRAGEELQMPYSAVRSRLTGIIRALGYEAPAEAKDEAPALTKPRAVLQDLEQGKISTEDAVRLLQENGH